MIVNITNILLILSIIIVFIKLTPKFNPAKSEKISGFYLMFTCLAVLMLTNTASSLSALLDIVILLFLLKLATLMLFLIKK